MAILARLPVMLRLEVAVSHVTMMMLQRTLTYVRKLLLHVSEQVTTVQCYCVLVIPYGCGHLLHKP